MVAEVRPLLSMGGATVCRSQGRASVIAVSSPGCEGYRLHPFPVPELGVSVASFVVSDKDGGWIPTSELGLVPPASGISVNGDVLSNGIIRLPVPGAICRLDSNCLGGGGEKGS